MPFTVGLTGGIGSGKSAAAQVFEELGIMVIDTDAVAHALTGPGGAAIEPIRAAFGAAYLTPEGALERARMRELVFANASKKRLLESILHPLIRARTSELVQAARSPYVILMVPLLVESGDYRRRCQRVLVVDCPEELQVERVMARSGLAAGQVRAIMANQVTREARLAAADDVVDNSQDLAQLRRQVEALHASYLQLAGTGA
ncbi:MAG: dephospho-CoA kinase [Betaproteobacteria bacterium RIFCSPLOWO2_12_FULL_62_13b]|nr:MAG: dephospho-CoA kinase [Betaproteobacteria bacterium RIFCSPLOWO2_12_FULL_62_13b]